MATGKKLHNLVLSLSPNEKRYFKLHSNVQNGKKNYLLLFATLEKMKEDSYSRELLLGSLKIPSEDLHTTENYLYLRILESLRMFSEKKSVEAKLYSLLLNASLLEEKGFYDLSSKMLAKAKSMVVAPNSNPLILEILKRQARHIAATETKNIQKFTDHICDELRLQANRLKEETEYFQLNQISFVRYRNWKLAKNETEKDFITALQQNPLIKKEPINGSFYTKYLRYNTKNNCYALLGQFDKACAEVEQIVNLWDLYPKLRAQQLELYIIQLSNLINHKNKVRDFETAQQLLGKLKGIKTKTFNQKAEQFQNFYFHQLAYYLNQYEFEAAIELVPKIKLGLSQYDKKINRARKLAFYYNIMIAYFIQRDYEAVIPWLFKIKKIEKGNRPRKDIQRFSRILNLTICYKIQTDRGLISLLNMYLEEEQKINRSTNTPKEVDLENMLRSIKRGNSYIGPLHTFEKTVLKYFKILFETIPGKAEKKVFKAFKADLEDLPKAQKEVLGFEEFVLWITKAYL
jgi:hypothetical protein